MGTIPQFSDGCVVSLQNVGICDYEIDVQCINRCRIEYEDSESLPDICSLCNEKRPVIFIDEEDISGLEESTELTPKLIQLTNDILGMLNVHIACTIYFEEQNFHV